VSEVPQGPGWWQAADLKWYPPELHADYVAPLPPPPTPPPPPTQSPVTTKGLSGQRKVGFVVAGLVLLIIAFQVVWRLLLPQIAAALLLPQLAAALLGLLVMVAIALIGLRIAVRSGQSGARKAGFVVALVLAVFAVPVVTVRMVPQIYGGGSSGGGGSANSSSFCTDFHNLWDSVNGVNAAIIAVQAYDVGGSPHGGGGSRPPGWSDSDLQTAAKNAETLAAEAPSDQLKTDFTNIAQTLSAAATGDYRYHGTGSENLDVNGSTLIARCRLQGAPGH
jgi:hypothetical protein